MILNRQRRVRVALKPLDLFLRRVGNEMNLARDGVTICLVSNAEIARMNEAFRKKKGPTDVLSFPAGRQWRATNGERQGKKKTKRRGAENTEKNGVEKEARRRHLGDIAIAPETARRYAKKNGRSLSSELRVLILHGVLHLLGYDHETDGGEMNRVENRLRRRLGLA